MSAGTPTLARLDTKAGQERTNGVVDTLIAPANEQVVYLPIDKIVEHPRNPKGRTDDVEDLAAGITAIGVQQPIVLATAKAYNAGRLKEDPAIIDDGATWVIVGGGHRRRAAARAAGLTEVPAFVRDHLADAAGRMAALMENLHRMQLSAFDEADAIAELVEFCGMKQVDIGKQLGRSQPVISKRLKLRLLPSEIRSKVELGHLRINDALELAKLVDDEPAFNEAWRLVNTCRWDADDAVARVTADRDAAAAKAKATAEAVSQGIPILDSRPDGWVYGPAKAFTINALWRDAPMFLEKHATEPCHAMFIDSAGGTLASCTDPKRHVKGSGDSKLYLSKAIADKLTTARSGSSSSPDAVRDRNFAQLRKTRPTRMAFVRSMLIPSDLTEPETRVLLDRGLDGHVFRRHGSANDVAGVILEILGVELGKTDYAEHVYDRKVANKPPAGVHLPLLVAIAHFELATRSKWHNWGDDERWYFELLAAHGYQPSDVEKRMTPKSRKAKATAAESAEAQ